MISRQSFSSPSLFLLVGTALAIFSSPDAIRASEVDESPLKRSLQEQPYEYSAPHVRAFAASISKDWQELEGLFALRTNEGRQKAKALYEKGAYCQSYATLKLTAALQDSIPAGTLASGKNKVGQELKAELPVDAFPGDSTIQVMYLIPDGGILQLCSVGGNPDPQYNECFQLDGDIDIEGGLTLSYTNYTLEDDTANGLSLQTLSSKIAGASTQGYPFIGTFTQYYGTNKYADNFIKAAFDKADTSFEKGNAEFSKFQQHGTDNFISMATLTMSSWMHVIIKMRDAVELCKSFSDDQKQQKEVPIWDNAVATYRGMGGSAGGKLGQLYHLANDYCALFGTCTSGEGNTEGVAQVNDRIYVQFNAGKQHLLDGKCSDAQTASEQAAHLMIIPLIQGLLYHTYELDHYDEKREIVQGEAAAFLHSILPLVSACSQGNAQMVYNQVKVGNGKLASFEALKTSLEGQYDCLKVTCDDIGGIVGIADKTTYQTNALPCGTLLANPQPIVAQPIAVPVAPPVRKPTPWPTVDPDDGFPTSTPTDPPSRMDEKIDFEAINGPDGVTYVLAIGLPVLSLIAVGILVRRHNGKKEKEFDGQAASNGEDPSPDDLKVENLQAEIL